MQRLRRLPWLTFQMIAANVAIVLVLGTAWYALFMSQSAAYSDRLMHTFNIEPGQLHSMFVEEVERQLWASVLIGMVGAVLASIGLTLLIVHPLRALARATDRIRLGDYSVRAKNRSGEVGNLAETLNALAAALEREEQRRARYLADLGHELRTPITSLRGYTEGLEDGIFAADAQFFSLMSDELSHLTALTHSIEALELNPEDQDATLRGVALRTVLDNIDRRWARQFLAKGLTLNVGVDAELAAARIALSDRSARHMIDNLMSNMLRHADEGSRCDIEVCRHGAGAIEWVFRNDARDLKPEHLPFLFDRFFRLSHARTRARQSRSTGLGLAIVKQICIANGGEVQAALETRRLSIILRLPLAKITPVLTAGPP